MLCDTFELRYLRIEEMCYNSIKMSLEVPVTPIKKILIFFFIYLTLILGNGKKIELTQIKIILKKIDLAPVYTASRRVKYSIRKSWATIIQRTLLAGFCSIILRSSNFIVVK